MPGARARLCPVAVPDPGPLMRRYSEGEWTHLMERCWEPDPQGRCSLREMAESLQRIIDEPEDQVG